MMDKDEQRLFSERGERLAEYRDALVAKDQEITKFKFICSEEHKDAVRLQAQRDEYREQLAAKDQELARMKDELAAKTRSNNDCVIDLYRKLDKLDDLNLSLKHQRDTLLAEAVWAMELVKDAIVERLERAPGIMNTVVAIDFAKRDPDYQRAHAFLVRPDVQARQKGAT